MTGGVPTGRVWALFWLALLCLIALPLALAWVVVNYWREVLLFGAVAWLAQAWATRRH